MKLVHVGISAIIVKPDISFLILTVSRFILAGFGQMPEPSQLLSALGDDVFSEAQSVCATGDSPPPPFL